MRRCSCNVTSCGGERAKRCPCECHRKAASAPAKWSLAECRERVVGYCGTYHERNSAGEDLAQLLALVDRMRAGLRRYGMHDNGNKDSRDDCARFYRLSDPCSCGLSALLAEIEGGGR